MRAAGASLSLACYAWGLSFHTEGVPLSCFCQQSRFLHTYLGGNGACWWLVLPGKMLQSPLGSWGQKALCSSLDLPRAGRHTRLGQDGEEEGGTSRAIGSPSSLTET